MEHNPPSPITRFFRKWKKRLFLIALGYLLIRVLVTQTILGQVDPMLFMQIVLAMVMQIAQVIMYFGFFFWFLGGRIRCSVYLPGDLSWTWDDFVGSEAIKDRAKLLVTLLTDKKRLEVLGGVRATHMMFHGPPGTGKTYLAKIIASMAGVPVMVIEASSLLGTFIGIGPLKVINLFKKAKKLDNIWGGAIMFVDEIDTIGGARGGTGSGVFSFMGGNVGGQILNVMLSCISGIGEPSGIGHRLRMWLKKNFGFPYHWREPNIIVIGATNKILQTLDAALVRPGRLEEHLQFPLPTYPELIELVKYYMDIRVYDLGDGYAEVKGVPHTEDCVPEAMAWIASGSSQAGIESAMNKAKKLAARDELDHITLELWTQAITEAMMGIKQPADLSERDVRLLSIHEAGHAYGAKKFAQQIVPFATIDRYGSDKLGHVRHMPMEQHILGTGRDVEESLVVALSSLVAEELFGERTPGTSADLDHVRKLTLLLISQGMIGNPWMLDPPKETGGRTVGAALPIATLTDEGRKLATAYFNGRKKEILECMDRDREVVTDLADALAEKRALKDAEIEGIIDGRLVPYELKPFVWEDGNDQNSEK